MKYPIRAITSKEISQFYFHINRALSVNMLKYYNDSTSLMRFLNSLLVEIDGLRQDIRYLPNFNLIGFDITQIDRQNEFNLTQIKLDVDNLEKIFLYGFSKYTKKWYTLEYIESSQEFKRDSIPCDGFFSDYVQVKNPETVDLEPNVSYKTDLEVSYSQITIKPLSGFNPDNLLEDRLPIRITVVGEDALGEMQEEELEIEINVPYVTKKEWKLITEVKSWNHITSISIELIPYLSIDELIIENDFYFDSDYYTDNRFVITIDKGNKDLLICTIRENSAEYPLKFDPIKSIPLLMPSQLRIENVHIDYPERLIYIIASKNGPEGKTSILFSYPLLVPKAKALQFIDRTKTSFQSVKVDYSEDLINKKFDIYVHPTSTTNDIEILNIKCNDDIIEENALLDLYSEGIKSNHYEINFSDYFRKTENIQVTTFELSDYFKVGSFLSDIRWNQNQQISQVNGKLNLYPNLLQEFSANYKINLATNKFIKWSLEANLSIEEYLGMGNGDAWSSFRIEFGALSYTFKLDEGNAGKVTYRLFKNNDIIETKYLKYFTSKVIFSATYSEKDQKIIFYFKLFQNEEFVFEDSLSISSIDSLIIDGPKFYTDNNIGIESLQRIRFDLEHFNWMSEPTAWTDLNGDDSLIAKDTFTIQNVIQYDTALLELSSYGSEYSYLPIVLDRTALTPIFVKEVLIDSFSFAENASIINNNNHIQPGDQTFNFGYFPAGSIGFGEYGYGGIISEESLFGFGGIIVPNISKLFKLSSFNNILIDGLRVEFVYKTFIVDRIRNTIITSDTITHLTFDDGILPEQIEIIPDEVKMYSFYYGCSATSAPSLLNLSELTSSKILTKPSGNFYFNAQGGKFLWICCPTDMGILRFFDGGDEISGFNIDIREVNGSSYTFYRSQYLQNGLQIELRIG